eukprot:SAG11_NODE_8890_length_965_cov_2.973441_1_plen_20_part_01
MERAWIENRDLKLTASATRT